VVATVALVLCGLLSASPVWASGDLGHRIICQIAFQELNPTARAEVVRLIAHDHFNSFTDACTWPDHPQAAWVAVPIQGWANESFQVTRRASVQYCVRVNTRCVYQQGNETYSEGKEEKVVMVNMAYLELHVPAVHGRLQRAGVRLAHLLNTSLGQ
jgi:hypothetical protein